MDKKIKAFGNTEIENYKFYFQKNPILIEDVEIILVKSVLNILLVTKIMKKVRHYV